MMAPSTLYTAVCGGDAGGLSHACRLWVSDALGELHLCMIGCEYKEQPTAVYGQHHGLLISLR